MTCALTTTYLCPYDYYLKKTYRLVVSESQCAVCGEALPVHAPFCPECGNKTTDSNSNSGITGQYSSTKRANKIANNADGKVRPRVLTQTKLPDGMWMAGDRERMLYERPLISYIEPDEQLHYIFVDRAKGLKITEPDGTEYEPHGGRYGKHAFLLITNKGLAYIAGYDGNDVVKTFGYEEIQRARIKLSAPKQKTFRFRSGSVVYEFTPNSYYRETYQLPSEMRSATRYIRRQSAEKLTDKIIGGLISIAEFGV